MGLYCTLDSLITESDVEQKFLYPLLSSALPIGLGYEDSDILTKSLLRQVEIGKRTNRKFYYPDYLISISGIPILIIEAKKPGEDLSTAYSEARLYATEVNAKFPHDVNVCSVVLVSNGAETWAGFADTAIPKLILQHNDFNVENSKFVELLDFCSKESVIKIASAIYVKQKGKAFFITPVSNLGGKRVQNEELEENAFGRTLVFNNRDVFDPESEDERNVIVDNAYVPSAKREQHVEPMYKEIRKFKLPSQNNSTALSTENPRELVDKISSRVYEKIEAYSLMLIIGNVGSGKSTFVRYFKRKYLEPSHPDLAKKCDWIFVNMNYAPHSTNEIYEWIKGEIYRQIMALHTDIHFTSLESLKHLFKRELKEFEDGIGQLLISNTEKYNSAIFDLLKYKVADIGQMVVAIFQSLRNDYGIIPIVVLDNCDKRDRDTQLLMFEIAQWLRTHFKCIVILPMRDITYDTYKGEKPLDTIVKDLVFRIDPPDLLKVLQARLDYISRCSQQRTGKYTLKNGSIVNIQDQELIEYYKSIMVSIRNSSELRSIFYRLSDRNTRKGIEIFEDFCKSGHITADEIFQIRATSGICRIRSYKFLNALLRKNRRFYDGDKSNFINLFYCDYNDDFPDPFVRIDILKWLIEHISENGPTNIRGMFKYNDVIHELELMGHSATVVKRELDYLIKHDLVFIENQLGMKEGNELIKISISGQLHYDMLNKVTYIGACAENVYMKNSVIVKQISDRLKCNNYLSKLAIALNAIDFLCYLDSYRKEYCACPSLYIKEGNILEIFDLSTCKAALEKWIKGDSNLFYRIEKARKYTPNKTVTATVIEKRYKDILCIINGNTDEKGFLSLYKKEHKMDIDTFKSIDIGDEILCEIIFFDIDYNNYLLRYMSKV